MNPHLGNPHLADCTLRGRIYIEPLNATLKSEKSEVTILPYSGLPIALTYIAAVLLIAMVFFIGSVQRMEAKAKAHIREYFGQIPPDDDRDIQSLAAYHAATVQTHCAPEIDGITWDDLDMDKVFLRINACESSVGEEYLYALLHRPKFEPQMPDKRERLIAWLDANPDARFDIQYTLACLGKEMHNGLAALVENARERIFKHASLFRVLAVMPAVSALLLFVNTALGVTAIISFALTNMLIYYYHKLRMDTDFVMLRYLAAMFACCKMLLRKPFPGWDALTADLASAYKPFKGICKLARTYFSQQTASELQVIVDWIKQSFLMDVVRYNKVMRTVSQHQREFRLLYAALGEIDAAVCILSFRKSLPQFCLPEFHEAGTIVFRDIYHPLLANPVPNSGAIKRGSIVTGSNASGKSTFIKALAVNGILAQTVHTCCAARFATRPALVMTSMAVRDSITESESYFITELKSLKRILDMLPKRYCACYIDEILRGTNTPERIAASSAVLKYMAALECLCVVASHDIELTELLSQTHDNYAFSELITEKGIEFDYKLHEGAAKTRNAILLLEHMGFDSAIIDDAKSRMN